MLFNSVHFMIFLPVVFTLYRLLDNKYRWMLLLASSYYFYMSWSIGAGAVLLLLTSISFYTALQLSKSAEPHAKKRWLWLGITCNLACLVAFKYSGFFYSTLSGLMNGQEDGTTTLLQNLFVPIGLSFYTFRLMAYIIDVYREKIQPEYNFGKFALFASFFPVILSGPIERFSVLGAQLFSSRKLNYNSLSSAVRIATWGYFKKIVIADRLAEFVDPVFLAPQNYSGGTLLIAAFFFVIQLYADFSGYTDIVTGVAGLFGIELSLNWRRPLLARSLVVFWKRYHITLTSWFHDYVYMPLVSNSRSYAFWVLNIFVVFLISGLWHGANVTFIAWGAMHGFVYVIEVLMNKKIKFPKPFFIIGWLYVITFHTLSLIAFRANNAADLGLIYKKIFAFNYSFSQAIQELAGVNSFFPLALSVVLIVFLFLKELNEEFLFSAGYKWVGSFARGVFYVTIFVLIFVLGKFNANEFIYSHF